MSDSKGGSRSDVGVTVTKLDRTTVRVASDYRRLGPNAEGETPFIVDLDRNPPTLLFNPRNEVAYGGTKQR
jgi:hypothetical protein